MKVHSPVLLVSAGRRHEQNVFGLISRRRETLWWLRGSFPPKARDRTGPTIGMRRLVDLHHTNVRGIVRVDVEYLHIRRSPLQVSLIMNLVKEKVRITHFSKNDKQFRRLTH